VPAESRLFRSGWLAAIQVAWTTAALFIVYRIITHRFGLGVLGLWSAAVALGSLVSVADGGLSDIMVRQVAEAVGRTDWARARGLHRALSAWSLLGLILVCTLAAPAMHVFLLPITPVDLVSALDALIVGALVVACLNIVTAAQLGVLEAIGRYDLKLLAAISASVLMVAVALATYAASSAAALVPLVFIAGAACNAGIGALMGWRLLRARAAHAERISGREVGRLLRIGVPVRLAGMLTLGLEPVTRAALTRLAGVDAVALYEIAYRVIFQLRSAIVAALQPLVPHLARLGLTVTGRHSETVLRAATCGVAVAVPALSLALIGLPALTIAVLGRAEPEVVLFGVLLSIAWLANIAAAPAYFANLVQGRVHRNWVSQAVMCLLNIALAPVAGSFWGATGVVAATSFAVFSGSVAVLLSRRDESRQLLGRLGRADWFALAGGVAGVVIVTFAWWHGLDGITLVGFETAVAVVYTASVALPLARRLPILVKGLRV
jgi:O-antigen/teichoic acid export membrane protein